MNLKKCLNKKEGGYLTAKQLKDYLLNNPSFIIKILEELECHHIKHIENKRITGALPDGDNQTSIQVLLNDFLTTVVHTRSDYKGGDIYEFVSYIKKCSFRNAFMFICRLLNIDCSFTHKPKIVNKTFNFLNRFLKKEAFITNDTNVILNETILDTYIKTAHKNFLNDNISIKSQYKFGIHYDIHDQRILIPIRDTNGNLVTIKGRAIEDGCKEKYIAYYPYSANEVLYGYYENNLNILLQNEVIIVEGEKSVMQADSYGVGNVVALSKKKISDSQLYKLISLNVDVVLALDKDVEKEEVEKMAKEFKGLAKVYAIYDKNDLLGEKDSPFDRGKDIWHELYKDKELITS